MVPTLGAQRAVPAAGYHPCLLRRVSRRAECMHFASPASCWVLGTRVAAFLLLTLVSGFEGSCTAPGVPRPWPGLPVVPGPALCRCGAVGQGAGLLGCSWEAPGEVLGAGRHVMAARGASFLPCLPRGASPLQSSCECGCGDCVLCIS